MVSTCMPRERWQRHRSMHTCGERRGGAVLSTRLHRYWPASLNLTSASRSQSQISSFTSASRSQYQSRISNLKPHLCISISISISNLKLHLGDARHKLLALLGVIELGLSVGSDVLG